MKFVPHTTERGTQGLSVDALVGLAAVDDQPVVRDSATAVPSLAPGRVGRGEPSLSDPDGAVPLDALGLSPALVEELRA